jgi:Family of unknown function (DUF6263)
MKGPIMCLRISLLSLLFVAVVAQAKGEEVNLVPRYDNGDKLVYEVETGVNQTLTLAGMNIETKVTSFEIKHKEVTDKSDDGGSKQKIYSSKVQFELSLPGGISVSFDSDNPDKESEVPQLNDMLKLLKVVSGMQITSELDNKGQLKELSVKAEGADELSDMFKSRLDPDNLKKQMKQELNTIPTKPVAPGDTWTRAEIFDAGSGQIFTYTTTYKYEGRVQEKGKTYDKVTATYAQPTFAIEAGSPLPIGSKSSDLSMEGSKSTMLLDVEKHQISQSTGETIFKGKIVLTDPNGNEIPGELDLKITSKLTRQAN